MSTFKSIFNVSVLAGMLVAFNACPQKFNSGSTSDISSSDIEEEFRNPPDEARPWVYWWWLDGNASKNQSEFK